MSITKKERQDKAWAIYSQARALEDKSVYVTKNIYRNRKEVKWLR